MRKGVKKLKTNFIYLKYIKIIIKMSSTICLQVNIDRYEINNIIQYVLIDLCNINVLGYDKFKDHFWCKKYDNSECILHIELNINIKGYICIEPKVFSQRELNIFIYDFIESIDICKTSNFIKNLLCNR